MRQALAFPPSKEEPLEWSEQRHVAWQVLTGALWGLWESRSGEDGSWETA